MSKKRLLILYHSQSGNTERLAKAVYAGANQELGTTTKLIRAFDASLSDLVETDGILIGTPENFGYMSGAIKDFFDRTYYPAQEHALNLPYALFISAGNDGSGAVREIDRILVGYPMKKVAEPVIVQGEVNNEGLSRCEELGLTMAAGLAFGIY